MKSQPSFSGHVRPRGIAFGDASHSSEYRILHRGVVSVGEWHSPGPDTLADALGNVNGVTTLMVTRRGVFVREGRSERTIAYTGVATVWHSGDTYQVTNPVPGSGLCTVFHLPKFLISEALKSDSPTRAERTPCRFPLEAAVLDGAAYLAHRLAVAAAARTAARTLPLQWLEADELAMQFVNILVARMNERVGRAHDDAPLRLREARNRYAVDYVMRVREVIERRYREAVTLSGIAAEVGCSPFHLSRVVSAHEGVSLYRMVLQLRLRDALERLLETSDPLATIALDAGFASQSHFGDAFRREFGSAPGVVRREHLRPSVPTMRWA